MSIKDVLRSFHEPKTTHVRIIYDFEYTELKKYLMWDGLSIWDLN